MIDIKELERLSKIVRIKELCREANVSYDLIITKLSRFRRNNNGQLDVITSHNISRVLDYWQIKYKHCDQ